MRATDRDFEPDQGWDRLRDEQVDNVPLQLTEERIRAESERIGNVELDPTPDLPSPRVTVAPPPAQRGPQPWRETVTPQPVTRQTAAPLLEKTVQPNRPGSILGLDTPLIRGPQPSASSTAVSPAVQRTPPAQERRPVRTSRAPWGAMTVLVLALIAETAYGYVALQRGSVNVSALPGAATVRIVSAETAGARSKSLALVETVYTGARRVAGAARDRYQQWRDR